MDKKKKYYVVGGIIVLILAFMLKGEDNDPNKEEITFDVKKGLFEVKVFTTGELEAKNSVDVKGPRGLRSVGIWRVQIADLVPEGTTVKKGDYIALLDKSEISGKISTSNTELTKAESKFTQTRLDTALDLRDSREKILNLEYAEKEKEITLEQSKYEPPATIRKAKIDLEKSIRALKESKENYQIKLKQSIAKMQEASAELLQATYKLEQLREVEQGLTIIAPEDGMVIYEREWSGKKKTTGSEISAWDATVATLPDLSEMVSKTYVNEVDIRKVKVGQTVYVALDAFPDKKLTGTVINVANVGEQLPNTDAKVFEVNVQVNEVDTTLRPGMTTGNNIIAIKLDDVLFIPLEAIHNQGDSLTFVFLKEGWGIIKKQITLGETNENYVIILTGLKEGETVLLSEPSDADDIEIKLDNGES